MDKKIELNNAENKLKCQFEQIDEIAFFNQKKVLDAFNEMRVSAQCFAGSTGYGYDDVGRDTLAKYFIKFSLFFFFFFYF